MRLGERRIVPNVEALYKKFNIKIPKKKDAYRINVVKIVNKLVVKSKPKVSRNEAKYVIAHVCLTR